jgi:hypothetical protein
LAAHNHIAGRGNPQTDRVSILANTDRLPSGGIYVDVAVGTLPQGVIAVRGMITMRKDCVPCEATSGAAVAAYHVAKTHLLRCAGVGGEGYLQSVRWRARGRKTTADTHITAGIGHRAADTHGLESPESRADLGNHTRYIVKFRFDSMEFDVEPFLSLGLDNVLVINPVLMCISSVIGDVCHSWVSCLAERTSGSLLRIDRVRKPRNLEIGVGIKWKRSQRVLI